MEKDNIEKIKKSNNSYLLYDILWMYIKKKKFFSSVLPNINNIWKKINDKTEIENLIKELKEIKNIEFNNNSSDIFYKERSFWCAECTNWRWCTVVISYKCNRDCFFCYEETPLEPKNNIDPNFNHLLKIIDTSFSNPKNKTLAITWWEPFLYPLKVYDILSYVNKNYKNKHTRIYSSWDLVTKSILIKLKELWLDEIRYSIKPFEKPNIELYKLSKKYINKIVIEMPVQPWSYNYMSTLLNELDDNNCIDWINLNELTFNNINSNKYKKRWYKLDLKDDINKIYQRYYDVNKVEIWVTWSKIECLKLLRDFALKKVNLFIHYCDLNTVSKHNYIHKIKHATSLWNSYSKINKYWLHRVLVIYSNFDKILNLFKNNNIKNYKIITKNNIIIKIETSIDYKNILSQNNATIIIIYKNYDYATNIDYKIIRI